MNLNFVDMMKSYALKLVSTFLLRKLDVCE